MTKKEIKKKIAAAIQLNDNCTIYSLISFFDPDHKLGFSPVLREMISSGEVSVDIDWKLSFHE